MNIAEIFELEDLQLVEQSFADLTDSRFNHILTEQGAREGRLLLDEAEEPLALAFQGNDGWIAGSATIMLSALFASLTRRSS